MSLGSSQIFEKLTAGTLRETLRDLGVKKWGSLKRDEMLAELQKLAGDDETSHVEENEEEESPITSKSRTATKPRKSLSAPGTSQKRKAPQASEEMDSISTAPATRSSRRKANESVVGKTRTTRSRAVFTQPPRKVVENGSSTSKRKRGQPSATDSEVDIEQADEEDQKQPAKRTRQAVTISSSRNARSQDEPSTRTTRSKGPVTSESISSTPRTTRASAARKESPNRIRSTHPRGTARDSISLPSRVARPRATNTRMDVDESASTSRALRSHAAVSSPVRVTRARPQPQEAQLSTRAGSRTKTYVSREAREARRRSRSAASASEAEFDSDGVDDADVPVPSSEEEEEAGEESDEEEEDLQTKKRGNRNARANSAPEPEPKRGRGRPRKTNDEPAPGPKKGRGRPRKSNDEPSPGPKRGKGRPRKTTPATHVDADTGAVATPTRPVGNRTIKKPNPYPTYASPVAAKGEHVARNKNVSARGHPRPAARGRAGIIRTQQSARRDKGKGKQEFKHKFDGVEIPGLSYKIQVADEEEGEDDGDYDLDPEHNHEGAGSAEGGDKVGLEGGVSGSHGEEADKASNEPEKNEHVEREVESSDGEWALSLADKVITSNGSSIPNQQEHIPTSQHPGETFQPDTGSNDEEMPDAPSDFAIPEPRPETEEPTSERVEGTTIDTGMDIDVDIRIADEDVEHEEIAADETVNNLPVENDLDVLQTTQSVDGEAEKENHLDEKEVVPLPHVEMAVDHAMTELSTREPVADEGNSVPHVETGTEQTFEDPQNKDQTEHETQDQEVARVHTFGNTRQEDEGQGTHREVQQDERQDVQQDLQQDVQQDVQLDVQQDTNDNNGEATTIDKANVQKPTEQALSESDNISNDSVPAGYDLASLHSRPDPGEVEYDNEPGEDEPTSSTIPTHVSSNIFPSLSDLHSRPKPGEQEEFGEDENEYGEEPNPPLTDAVNDVYVGEGSPRMETEIYDLDEEYEEAEVGQLASAGATPEAFNGFGDEAFVEREEPSTEGDLEDMMNIHASASASVDLLDGEDGTMQFESRGVSIEEGTVDDGISVGTGQRALVDDGSMYLNEDAFAMDAEETSMTGVAGGHVGQSSTSGGALPGVDIAVATTFSAATMTTQGSYI
ncbi:hypothetical protein E1B28_003194 [Marasmius oreades]|uniref:SAP domain-containing protein n=1 Tax=Marasmius oreades TaxID=181124 RepID=A0A9P7RMK3_9AGAR|nr:uncharacterized protein E1B28_003194 [Marasmius oreades]KAG7085648.1 hypothetical protein E1B28_003194 [Marasmius oreades]